MFASDMERVSLRYDAAVFVTVNVKTGDVERVYLDDEGIELNEREPFFCVDSGEWPIDETRHDPGEIESIRARALKIAENVDWTSTDNRCQVWRGAYGGPGDIVGILKAAVDFFVDFSEQFPASLSRAGVTESELRATQLFLRDTQVWEAEH